MLQLLSPAIPAQTEELRRQFTAAEPLRHVVIDSFLDPAYLDRLASEFPAFDRAAALNEFGEVGRQVVRKPSGPSNFNPPAAFTPIRRPARGDSVNANRRTQGVK